MSLLIRSHLLNKDELYLIAVSFGPDSRALLDTMYSLGYHIAVAHVNYHQRPQSNLEQTGVEQYCLTRDIPLYILDVDKDASIGNFQAWARKIRYQFFVDVAKDISANAILTAHHFDDHIETILLQKKRKTMSFCMGICEKTTLFGQQVIRPLLDVTKDELIKYCIEHDVDYAIDSSNLSDKYERNRVRHYDVPNMTSQDIKAMADEAKQYNLNTTQMLSIITQRFVGGKLLVNDVFAYQDRELFLALHLLFQELCPDIPISKTLLAEVRNIAHGSKAHWRRHLMGSYWLVRSYDTFEVVRFDGNSNYEFVYQKPSRDDNPYFFMDFTVKSYRNVAPIECYPLTIRSPQPGDCITIGGHKRLLRRLFIDWKLPRHRRSTWPVIVDKNGQIIFVPRYRPEFKKEDNPIFFVK